MHNLIRGVVETGGVSLAYAEAGQGPAVVYIHGALMTLEEGVLALGEAFADFRFIAFDRPGHGDSPSWPGAGSAWRQAAAVHGAVQKMGAARPVVIGHSFGGAVASAYALQFPEDLAGVVALGPVAFPEPRLEQVLLGPRALPAGGPWLNAASEGSDALLLPLLWEGMFLPQLMPAAFRIHFPFESSARRSQLQADGEEALWMAADLVRSVVGYPSARVPLRVLQGEMDLVVNPNHGRMMAALWPGGQFRSLPGVGHMAHHFAPEAVLNAVEDILAA